MKPPTVPELKDCSAQDIDNLRSVDNLLVSVDQLIIEICGQSI